MSNCINYRRLVFNLVHTMGMLKIIPSASQVKVGNAIAERSIEKELLSLDRELISYWKKYEDAES